MVQKSTFGLRTQVFISLEKKGSEHEEEMVFCGFYISKKKLRHIRFSHVKIFEFRFKLKGKCGFILTEFSKSHLLHRGRLVADQLSEAPKITTACIVGAELSRVKQLYSGANYVSVQLLYNYAALLSDADVYIGLCLCLNWSWVASSSQQVSLAYSPNAAAIKHPGQRLSLRRCVIINKSVVGRCQAEQGDTTQCRDRDTYFHP